jgi:hypothetical protein
MRLFLFTFHLVLILSSCGNPESTAPKLKAYDPSTHQFVDSTFAGTIEVINQPSTGTPVVGTHNPGTPVDGTLSKGTPTVGTLGPESVLAKTLSIGTNTPSQEVINDGAIFSVTNPQIHTCYFRMTKNDGSKHVFKQVRTPQYGSIVHDLNCGHFNSYNLNFCRSKFVRVEVFSRTDLVCNFAVTSPKNGDRMAISLERGYPLSGIHIAHCNTNEQCYNKKKVQLTERGTNKFDFTTSEKNGFQGHFIFENHTFQNGGAGLSNEDYKLEYRNILQRM